MLLDNVLLPAAVEDSEWVGLDLLNLQRDRLAYRATRNVEKPLRLLFRLPPMTVLTAQSICLSQLICMAESNLRWSLKMYSAMTLMDSLEVIQSQWMTNFTRQSMRDILRLSWSKIESRGEYDQFVGASVTPKSVSNKIYDALVFIQSNRIALMGGG